MSRYIDADELIKEAEKDGAYGYVSAEQIANFPTAKVVKRGRWIETTKAVMSSGEFMYTELRTICSLCGKEPLYSYWHNEVQTPWCPWCGAKMDEVEE